MVITRTPLRVSFIGGGSDYPNFFNTNDGYVFGTTINLFVYTAVIKHSSLADAKFKLTYRLSEAVDSISELQHPLVRETLKRFSWENPGLHIATLADVPASTGLGSSSAFAVSLIQALSKMKGQLFNEVELAQEAIALERDVLAEAGGWQDQIHSAIGGFNLIKFSKGGFEIAGRVDDSKFIEYLNHRMVLISTGNPRASHIEAEKINSKINTSDGVKLAKELARMAKSTGEQILRRPSAPDSFHALASAIRIGWDLKTKLSPSIPNDVSETIELGLANGAISAKLCGAGSSGFVLFLTEEPVDDKFLRNFPQRRIQRIRCHLGGSETGLDSWF